MKPVKITLDTWISRK